MNPDNEVPKRRGLIRVSPINIPLDGGQKVEVGLYLDRSSHMFEAEYGGKQYREREAQLVIADVRAAVRGSVHYEWERYLYVALCDGCGAFYDPLVRSDSPHRRQVTAMFARIRLARSAGGAFLWAAWDGDANEDHERFDHRQDPQEFSAWWGRRAEGLGLRWDQRGYGDLPSYYLIPYSDELYEELEMALEHISSAADELKVKLGGLTRMEGAKTDA